jgi:hypothetical protein
MVDERFFGTWELLGTEQRGAGGELVPGGLPYATGQVIYSADGRMSAHLMGPNRPTADEGSREPASSEFKAQAYDSYLAYYGTYTVDAAAGVITHHIHGSLFPEMAGTEQRRHFELSGDRLTLSPPATDGGPPRLHLIWQRVGGV